MADRVMLIAGIACAMPPPSSRWPCLACPVHAEALALRYYRFATLIAIFYGQVFAFYQLQFGAIVVLLFYVLILAGIRGLLEAERKTATLRPAAGP